VVEELAKRGLDDVIVIGGGIIPAKDVPALERSGVRGVFGPGSPTSEIAAFITSAVAGRAAHGPASKAGSGPSEAGKKDGRS
jgi:methylmalonyl-CoA mutase C-terminal domain/subunit